MENKTLDLTLTRFAARESRASVERPEIRMTQALSRRVRVGQLFR